MDRNFMSFGNRRKNTKFSKVEWDMLRQIHSEQERDLSGHVVDEEKLHNLHKEEEYIFELQTEILKLYEDVAERQAKEDTRIKKLRKKNNIKPFCSNALENLEGWDGKSEITETDDEAVKVLQQSALEIVQENWKTKEAIDSSVGEIYELELQILYKKVDKVWEKMKDLPLKNPIQI